MPAGLCLSEMHLKVTKYSINWQSLHEVYHSTNRYFCIFLTCKERNLTYKQYDCGRDISTNLQVAVDL